jgi:NAD+ synthase
MTYNPNALTLDCAAEVDRIVQSLRTDVTQLLRRKGCVLGVSGGVDSAVVLALCVRAMGPDRVVPVLLPEKDSDPASEQLARQVCDQLGVKPVLESITPVLEGCGCYQRRDAAVRRVVPEYDATRGDTCKIVLPSGLQQGEVLNVFSLVVVHRDGAERRELLPFPEYAQIMAASNFKQRARMAFLYYHAEVRHFAVIGTPNKNEHQQGFFVKHGDGAMDVKPIAHLYKTQVYQIAEYLQLPVEIRTRPPATDTYSAHGTQEEFFFRLPFEILDPIWLGLEQGAPAEEVARTLDLSPQQVESVYTDLRRRFVSAAYLRSAPIGMAQLNPETLTRLCA